MPKRLLILTTALAGLTFCLCLFNGFVGDDEVMIVRNEFYRSLDNLPLLISDRYISDSREYFLNSGTYNSSGGGIVPSGQFPQLFSRPCPVGSESVRLSSA